MKITAVETCVVSLPFDMGGPKPAFAGKPWTTLDVLVVKVETEDGLEGWGEAFGHAAIPATKAEIDTILAPLLLGQDARDLNAVSRRRVHAVHLLGRNGPFIYAFAGIDIALWDLAGKRTGQPLWRLLGGRTPAPLEAYASLLNYRDDALVRDNTAAACAAGYRSIKLHQTTLEAVVAAQQAPGATQARIMLDVNCAWLPPAAQAMAASLADRG